MTDRDDEIEKVDWNLIKEHFKDCDIKPIPEFEDILFFEQLNNIYIEDDYEDET